MTNIVLYDVNGKRIDSLSQWDYDVSIKIGGVKTEPVPEIRCWNKNTEVAKRVKAEISNGFVKFVIPNELLQERLPISVQLFYFYESGDSKAEYRFIIPIIPGKMPEGYIYSPSDVTTFESLEKRIETLERLNYSNAHYIATDYGVRADAEDNTAAMQALIDAVGDKGGGVIWMPVGEYRFRRSGDTYDKNGTIIEYAIKMRPNVSIVGESKTGTVLRQVDPVPYTLFFHFATADSPFIGFGCGNLTIDAYDTGNTNFVTGKAFYAQYLRDCWFDNLILRGTVATALGIDYLDRVYMSHITCIDCGRTYHSAATGTSGIGIGTGGWADENYIISDCVCVGCGQYGIFIESQNQMTWGGNYPSPRGAIISNCIVRDGLNKGIGIRGGQHVTVIGCESYGNAADGIYLDLDCQNVHIRSCSATDNGGQGIRLNPGAESRHIEVNGCSCVGNTGAGIHVERGSDKFCLKDNYTDGNDIGLRTEVVTLPDCVIYGNVFLDDVDSSAYFTGNTKYCEIGGNTAPAKIVLNSANLTAGKKLMPDGSEAAEELGQVSGYLDVSAMGTALRITTTGHCDSIRVAQYDADRNSLVTDAAITALAINGTKSITVDKIAGCAYARLFYTKVNGELAQIQSIVVETAP